MSTVAILNPGAMGVTIGAAAKAAGSTVPWASEGRSDVTRARAEAAGLEERQDLASVIAESDVVLSVCPPHAALDMAQEVAGLGFAGLYVDGNAVAPSTALKIGQRVEATGARFVDGGIIGPPACHAGSTRLYLSGVGAEEAVQLFQGSVLAAVVCGDRPGAASALKMCYAAWTKGSAAMLMAVRAAADAEGLSTALTDEWALSMPGPEAESEDAAGHSAAKAWRFAGEMREIADTFAANELPGGFHGAAAELYDRLASFKDAEEVSLDAVIKVLNKKD